MKPEPGVTIFMPVLNEVNILPKAVDSALAAAKEAGGAPFELIIVNDGSTDGTAELIKTLAQGDSRIRDIHHAANQGLGVSFLDALAAARYDKIALFPGDHILTTGTLSDMIRNAHKADVIFAYTVNKELRSRFRVLLSALHSRIYTATFGLDLRYIHGAPVYPVETVRALSLNCKRYSFASEIAVKLLRSGGTFMEIPGYHNPVHGKSHALRIKNLLEVSRNYLRLAWEVYASQRSRFERKAVRVSA